MQVIVAFVLSVAFLAGVFFLFGVSIRATWNRLGSSFQIALILGSAALILIAESWWLKDALLVGWRSQNWPSALAEPVRYHLIGIPTNDEAAKYKLELPYIYAVGDSVYRGSQFSSRGPFVGTRQEILALRDDFSDGMHAYYNPSNPSQSVLRSGVALDARSRVVLGFAASLLVAAGSMSVQATIRRRQTQIRESRSRSSLVLSICVAVGLALFLIYVAASRWRLYVLEARMTGGYTVVAEDALDNGVEYWIAVYPIYSLDGQPEPEWVQDQVDATFLADDGTLKPIEYRRWNVYRDAHFKETKSIPQRAPDWIMEWRIETGLRIGTESGGEGSEPLGGGTQPNQ